MKNSLKQNSTIRIIKILKFFGFGRGGLKKILAGFLKYSLGNEKILFRYNGIKFILNPSDNSTDSKMIVSSRILEQLELNYLKSINKSKEAIFLDIGANIGYYSLMSTKLGFKKVYAFEPVAHTFLRLQDNIKINSLGKIVIPIQKAVGEKNADEYINEDLENIGNSSILIKGNKSKKIKIGMIELSNYLKKNNIMNIDAIKLDIEGYEDRALINLFTNKQNKILPKLLIIEHSNKELWKYNLFEKLEAEGYRKMDSTRGNTIYMN